MGMRGKRSRPRRSPLPNEQPTGMHGGRYRRRQRERAEATAAATDGWPASVWDLPHGVWDLVIGPLRGAPSPFGSEEQERAAWFRYRDEILRGCRPGKRPNLWWVYEGPPSVAGGDTESAHIYLTIADEAERIAIEDMWRENVAHCLQDHPHDRAAARELAFSWGDVPRWVFAQIIAGAPALTPPTPIKGRERARV